MKPNTMRNPATMRTTLRLLLITTLVAGVGDVHAQQRVGIEEIVVTATRREQTVHDIPYNISALSGEELESAGVVSLVDLARVIPGVAYADLGVRSGAVNNQLILRGLNANAQGSIDAYLSTLTPAAVSTYIDDTPLFANLQMNDLERVELLRGPQGTLYGAGSVGGTLRFIFNKPDPEKFAAEIDSRIDSTAHSDEWNYEVDGVVNVPLTSAAALRVVAGYRKLAGFTDGKNLAVGGIADPQIADPADPFGTGLLTEEMEDLDDADQWSVRASLLWEIHERIEAQFTYQHQEDSADGFSMETNSDAPGSQDRTMDQYFTSPLDREIDLYSLELDIELGFAQLESSSSYTVNRADNAGDLTGLALVNDIFSGGFAFGGWPNTNGRLAGYYDEEFKEKSFAQEVRLVSTAEGKLDWVAGFYYQHLDRDLFDVITSPGFADYANTPGHPYTAFLPVPPFLSWANLIAGPPGFVPQAAVDSEVFFTYSRPLEIDDVAIFGELSYRLTEAWQVTVGARVFWNEHKSRLVSTFPVFGAVASADGMDPSGLNEAEGEEDVQDELFKVNTSYEFSEALMAYFTWAEGFRRGGANAFPLTGFNSEDPFHLAFEPDTVTNYEIGMKGSLFERMTFTAAIYRIDWDKPQLAGTFLPSGFQAVVNAEEARTQGIELEGQLFVTDELQLTAGYTYTDAEFTQEFASRLGPSDVFPDFSGSDGSPLPGVPEHMATWAIDYIRPVNLFGPSQVHLRVDGSYRSSVVTASSPTSPQFEELRGFDIWNASLTWSNDHWRAGFFIQNIGDEKGITAVVRDFVIARPEEALDFLTRPRTAGVMIGYTY
ncbi:MAG: TonB-dependent receptor [Gammaproteobacteria bacterium]